MVSRKCMLAIGALELPRDTLLASKGLSWIRECR